MTSYLHLPPLHGNKRITPGLVFKCYTKVLKYYFNECIVNLGFLKGLTVRIRGGNVGDGHCFNIHIMIQVSAGFLVTRF